MDDKLREEAPKRVYLQWHPEITGSESDCTWCSDKIDESDTEYIRADIIPKHETVETDRGDFMSVADIRKKCVVRTNDVELNAECPHGKNSKIASYGCQNCGHCLGKYSTNSVYCSFEIDKRGIL